MKNPQLLFGQPTERSTAVYTKIQLQSQLYTATKFCPKSANFSSNKSISTKTTV